MKITTLLEVKGLSLKIDTETVVKSIDFEVPQNQITALVGASGSGKSLTALSLMNIQPKVVQIQCEKLLFDGDNLLLKTPKEWESIRGNTLGMIFQEPQSSLNPSMPCGRQVKEALLQHQTLTDKAAKEQVIQAFEKVQLPDPERIYTAYPHQISGGQKQRVMIAMALINNPKLLIADEPTTALDVSVQKEIIALLKKLQQQHRMSVLFISHDLELVRVFADRVLVMQDGEIVESGACESVFNNPKHPYTQGLINARPPTNKRPERLPKIHDFIHKTVPTKNSTKAQRQKRHQALYAQPPLLDVKEVEKRYVLEAPFGRKNPPYKRSNP